MNTSTPLAGRLITVRLIEEGIVLVECLPGAHPDLETAMAVTDEIHRLGGPLPLLCVDVRNATGLDREARVNFGADPALAGAFVVGSPVSRVLANFFIGIGRPAYPTRIFNSQETAIAWLKQRRA